MWSEELKCKKCDKQIDISEADTAVTCENCGEKYNIIEDELFYATASSGTSVYYEITDDWKIKRIHFYNQPRDLLDEAYQNSGFIWRGQQNPFILVPIVRKYHDALKKRLQVFLTLGYIPNLNTTEKARIKTDNPPQSILNLILSLKKAFPSSIANIDNVTTQHEVIIKRMKWIRDKSEHPLLELWSMPGKVYEDRAEEPNSINPPQDYLDYDFILETNAAVINTCILLLQLDPQKREAEQYEILEAYRLP